MTREEFIEDIKISLGAPIVEVEVEELIGKLVDKAFREVSRYITETHYVTIPYREGGIDVSQYHINTVVQIFRTHNPARVLDMTDIYTLSALSYGNSTNVNLLLSDYLYRTQMTQIKNTISTDLDWTYDFACQKLYVNTVYPKPSHITLSYIPEFKDVSDVIEQYWINYINRLALAFTKEALGRVRGKYTLSSSLYSLDGNQLLSEGIAERDAVRAELNENSDIILPLD